MFKCKKKKTGVQTPEFRRPTPPPSPPTSGSNAVKPNPNYIPPASVTKPRTMLCIMKFEDLKDWVKTKAQIGDVAYHHDHMLDRDFIYCYRKPDDNPSWVAMDPYFLEKYFKKENKGDKEVIGTINCTYETPCGWCTKWDKKCDKKIGPEVMPVLKMPDHVAENIIEDVKNRMYESCGVSKNLIKENKQ